MSASLTEVLLRIAAAVAADSGAGVRKALEDALFWAVPFDAGELALVRSHGDTWRQPLVATEGPILGRDLLEHVLAHGAPYRIDDWRDAEPFVETLGLLRARALRSLLTVPFRFDAPGVPPVTGALTVGRSHGWGFVGASLPLFVPLASMAGLAFDRALALTTLRERAQALESVSPRSARRHPEDHRRDAPTPAAEAGEEAEGRRAALQEARRTAAERERERDQARAGAEAARQEAERTATALREAHGQGRDLNTRAEAAEARLRELQERVSELEGTIRALESGGRQREEESRLLAASTDEVAERAAASRAALEARLGEAEATSLALRADLDGAGRRLDETLGVLEEARRAQAEAEVEHARLEGETARLEAERIRLEEELKQAGTELQIALDQIGALSPPASVVDARGRRDARPGRRDRPR